MSDPDKLLVSVVGPTAVGKTSFAIKLAMEFETEIISVDSRQCYRELDIGTAKPSEEELSLVRHHFINSHSIHENISAGAFEKFALEKIDELFKVHDLVLAVGGSGLYFQALWGGMDKIPSVEPSLRTTLNDEYNQEGLEHLLEELRATDPSYYDQVDKKNPQRVLRALEVIRGTGKSYSSFREEKSVSRSFRNLKIGLTLDREILYKRIDQRMDQMIEAGLFEEAESLKAFRSHNALQTVGYREIFDYLDGAYVREEAIRLLKRNSRRYAKRQYTWFNRDQDIIWLDPGQIPEAIDLIRNQSGI